MNIIPPRLTHARYRDRSLLIKNQINQLVENKGWSVGRATALLFLGMLVIRDQILKLTCIDPFSVRDLGRLTDINLKRSLESKASRLQGSDDCYQPEFSIPNLIFRLLSKYQAMSMARICQKLGYTNAHPECEGPFVIGTTILPPFLINEFVPEANRPDQGRSQDELNSACRDLDPVCYSVSATDSMAIRDNCNFHVNEKNVTSALMNAGCFAAQKIAQPCDKSTDSTSSLVLASVVAAVHSLLFEIRVCCGVASITTSWSYIAPMLASLVV